MFVDNENQLKNYGMQLQNMGMEIHNFGLQMKNNMMINIGNQMIIQNIGDQIQNIGDQISNIAMQIFNMGIQISNIIMNQNNINMMNQNNIMNNNMMMNGINEEIMNDNNEPLFYSVVFRVSSGQMINININSNKTLEDLLNLYLNRMGLGIDDIQKKKIFFLNNGQKIDLKDKTKIKEYFKNHSTSQKIEVIND